MTTERKINFLLFYTILLSIALIISLYYLFKKNSSTTFGEISVERINVVEKNGDLKMVISNKQRQHPGTFDGKQAEPREREPGIIFFNGMGDECGGLIYDATKSSAGLIFSVDQYGNDQLMQLQYQENLKQRSSRSYGLKLWDRRDDIRFGDLIHRLDSIQKISPEIYEQEVKQMKGQGMLGTERLFVGRNDSNETGLFIRDKKGVPRIKIYINDKDETVMEVVDKEGKTVGF